MNHASHLYLGAAQAAASAVIHTYSSSFSLATRLLAPQVRTDIQTLYAVVRIADEIVDGAAQENIAQLLDSYEAQILTSPQQEFHTDPVVHAYAEMVRRIGIRSEDMQAFFNAMRMDTQAVTHDAASRSRYIYGSAEVIGLMCLQIFLSGTPASEKAQLGARRLGHGFQVVNFIRDLAADHRLGRDYYPGITEAQKNEILDDAIADIAAALATTTELPLRCRKAVRVAAVLYRELALKLQSIPLDLLQHRRYRLNANEKALALGRNLRPGKRGSKKP